MRNSRIIPVALILIIIAIAIAALITLARAVFFSDTTQTVSDVDTSRTALLNTAVDHSVTMTVRGSIVADEQFRSYRIAITPTTRTLTTYTGYLDKQIDQINLANNTTAYEEFIYALEKANYVKGSELTGDENDRRGICATGKVYEFGTLTAGKSVKTLWTTSCSNAKGSLNASVTALTALFLKQVPDSPITVYKIGL
ncbi:hypothetical protein BH10PAT4_BH10PAT4_3780 [soil metagenome]